MFGLPQSTELRKVVHKKLIFAKFPGELNGDRKKRFDNDISRIGIVNEISPSSVNIKEGESIKSIFVVQIELKTKNYDERNVLLISKLFGQQMLIILKYEEEYQLAVYQTKLLYSDWKSNSEMELHLNGLDLDSMWLNMVEQVSGIIPKNGNSLDEQIAVEVEKAKLMKQIDEMETQARKETQSKKKFDMFQRMKEYQKLLEKL
ncbi:DUF4391 domain-containing protein [[Clostridium] fimetarium]|uniref:DUF4391 domain-containing protein n=1 Tax=[Clostridium] fimetarium TaxID=99656 RepID=A0A1I0Q0E8_9FIRM|nr:DUF4391 domain-containing protein [[Clostridium] fimetarium]SEW20417.1 protein of unknown function [[Clostridium] fimetarium]